MDKVIYWLKKIGILRVGTFSAKGDAKKMVDMEMKSELYQSDKEIENENDKKKNKTTKKEKTVAKTTKKSKSIIGKIIFWILVLMGFFFLLAFWGAGWSFWTVVGLLMWAFFLRWAWVHITAGLLAIGKIIFLSAVLIFLSLVFATPNEEGKTVKKEVDKKEETSSKKDDSSKLKKGVKNDTVAKFLVELGDTTGLDFSKVKDDDVTWTASRNLALQKAKSFKAEDLSAKDFDKLEKYFLGYGADTGGIGFTFVPPVGTQSSGFAFRNKEHSGMMCVLTAIEEEGVLIGCGWGPTSNPNSK